MRKLAIALCSLFLLLSGCAPNFQKQEQVVDNAKDKEKAIIPKYRISDIHYRTLLPFVPSEARGLVVNNLNTRYDINEFEIGLMRIAQNSFDPDQYIFREGQELDKKTVTLWLNRKFSKKQLEEEKLTEKQNIGLNPLLNDSTGTAKSQNEKSPIYLAHILEHDYMVKGDNDTIGLGGIVIGLALNSVHYYREIEYGDVFEKEIEKKEMEREGKKIAQEVLSRLRQMKGLGNIPITIALFEQQAATSVVPGTFFAYTEVKEGSTIDDWERVNEQYYIFPSKDAEEKYREDVTAFKNFKQDVEEYFPNFNGVVGKAHYVEGQLQDLNITIPIQFYGKAESIGFTQYVTGLVLEHFPKYISVSVGITSVNGQEALIVRKADQEEPFVHIYQ